MTLRGGGWRRKLALIASVPVVASVVVLGASTSAWAHTIQSSCSSFRTCYYANSDFTPGNSVLNMGRESVSNWTNIADTGHVCGGIVTHTWNDCASSIKDTQTATDMCNYANASFVVPVLITVPGESLPNLVNNSFNDKISSNRPETNPDNC